MSGLSEIVEVLFELDAVLGDLPVAAQRNVLQLALDALSDAPVVSSQAPSKPKAKSKDPTKARFYARFGSQEELEAKVLEFVTLGWDTAASVGRELGISQTVTQIAVRALLANGRIVAEGKGRMRKIRVGKV